MQFLSIYLSLIVLSSGIFPDLPPTTRWRAGCRGGTPSLPKSPSLRYPPGRKSHHDLSEVGASRMAQTVPPFSGGLWVVVGVTGGSVGEGVCGGGGDHCSKLSLICKSHVFWPINIATHLPQIGQRIARHFDLQP